jgi:hypothetical protein
MEDEQPSTKCVHPIDPPYDTEANMPSPEEDFIKAARTRAMAKDFMAKLEAGANVTEPEPDLRYAAVGGRSGHVEQVQHPRQATVEDDSSAVGAVQHPRRATANNRSRPVELVNYPRQAPFNKRSPLAELFFDPRQAPVHDRSAPAVPVVDPPRQLASGAVEPLPNFRQPSFEDLLYPIPLLTDPRQPLPPDTFTRWDDDDHIKTWADLAPYQTAMPRQPTPPLPTIPGPPRARAQTPPPPSPPSPEYPKVRNYLDFNMKEPKPVHLMPKDELKTIRRNMDFLASSPPMISDCHFGNLHYGRYGLARDKVPRKKKKVNNFGNELSDVEAEEEDLSKLPEGERNAKELIKQIIAKNKEVEKAKGAKHEKGIKEVTYTKEGFIRDRLKSENAARKKGEEVPKWALKKSDMDNCVNNSDTGIMFERKVGVEKSMVCFFSMFLCFHFTFGEFQESQAMPC